MVLIYISLGVIMGAILFAAFLLLPINGGYMFLFEREEWRYWRLFSRNVKNFKYIGRYSGDGKSYMFAWEDYIAIVWSGNHFDGYSSVHAKGENGDCLCTMFWEPKSLHFAKTLMKSIEGGLKYTEPKK